MEFRTAGSRFWQTRDYQSNVIEYLIDCFQFWGRNKIVISLDKKKKKNAACFDALFSQRTNEINTGQKNPTSYNFFFVKNS